MPPTTIISYLSNTAIPARAELQDMQASIDHLFKTNNTLQVDEICL
jgi:hypothetical protein